MQAATPEKPPFEVFYLANKGLAFKVAQMTYKRVLALGWAVEFADLEQEATMTMMRAYEGFDPSLGFTFSTYFMRAAFNDINRFLRTYERDKEYLNVTSMDATYPGMEDRDPMESIIDGHHATPEQLLEGKQLLESLEEQLSPLANLLLKLTLEPTPEMDREWELVCKATVIEGHKANDSVPAMPASFVNEFVAKMDPTITLNDVKAARTEITRLGREILEQRY